MRNLIILTLICTAQLAFAAPSNITLSIPVVNQSHYPLADSNAFQFIGVTLEGSLRGGSPEIITYNMDNLNAPVNGKLMIVRPRGSSFKFGMTFFSTKVNSDFCIFQLSPISADQDDVSLIKSTSDAPVTCSYAIDAATQQPTITIQDNPAHAA